MSKLIEKTRLGTLLQGGSQVLLALAGYVIAVTLARVLGPADFGVYGLVYSFVLAVELITMFGIPGAVSRLTADRRDLDGRIGGTGLTLVLCAAVLALGLLWLLAPLLAQWLGIPAAAMLIRIAALDVPCFGAYFLILHVLNGRRDFLGESIANVGYTLTKVVGILALALTELTIAGALLVNVLASMVGLICVLFRAGRQKLGLSSEAAATIMQLAVPVALIAVGTQVLLYIDLWFLGGSGAGVGEKLGGYYVAAKNLARVPNLIAFVMTGVLIPSIAHAIATEDAEMARRIVRGSMRFMVLTLLPGCALLATKAAQLMALLFSEEYAAGAPFLQLLVLANGLMQTMCSTLVTILVATRHQRAGAAIALLVLPPAVVLSAVLIPALGAMGAAIASISSSTIALLAAGYVTYRHIGAFVDLAVLIKASLATALVCVLAALVPMPGPWVLVELILAALLFLGLSIAFGLVSRDDLAVVGRGRSGDHAT